MSETNRRRQNNGQQRQRSEQRRSRHAAARDIGTLAHLLREVRYGSIEIVVHEGRVTQIERREKMRVVHRGTQEVELQIDEIIAKISA